MDLIMALAKVLILLSFFSLALSNEIEEVEQKKRATIKGNTVNAIPSGAQKQEYNYLYQQPSQGPPTQPPNSFYPTVQTQYYNQAEQPTYQPQYVQQNQQFVPLNFVPNPGYQAKYQVVPKGNIQLAVFPQQAYLSPPPVYQQHQVYTNPSQNVPQGQYQTLSPQHYQSYLNQPLQYQQPAYLGQPSMVIYSQPQNPYNVLYSNAAQQLYNYFQTNPQAKYQLLYGNQAQQSPQNPQPQEYDKPLPGPYTQNISKDDNDLSNDYVSAESSTAYKNSYLPSRTSSYKSR